MAEQQDSAVSQITVKSVAKYALLPGVLPRLQRLADHVSQFLFMFTQVFGSVGLIDRNHPCLRPENIGLYRFRDIIGLAASNVVFDKKHIPQIIMFFGVVLSLVLTAAIFLGMLAGTMMNIGDAQAQLFGTPSGTSSVQYGGEGKDWAMNFMYRIFGDAAGMFPVPANGAKGNPFYTSMLTGMLKYYSLAMLLIAALMIAYILIITVTESARTGKPFGTRFDGAWAPIRIALAIGLLMPITSSGYNGAQMVTFQAAKWGSNLATNVWYGGLRNMEKQSEGFFTSMMADPGYRFVRDMFLVNLCVAGLEEQKNNKTLYKGDIKQVAVAEGGKLIFSFGPKSAPDFCGQVAILVQPLSVDPQELSGNSSWPKMITIAYRKILADFLPIDNYAHYETSEAYFIPYPGKAVVFSERNKMAEAVNHAASTYFKAAEGQDTYFVETMKQKYPDATPIRDWMMSYWSHLGVKYSCDTNSKVFTDTLAANCTSPRRSLYFKTAAYDTAIKAYNKWAIESMTKDAQFGWTTAGVFYLRITMALSAISEVADNAPRVIKLPSNLTKPFATADNPSANTDILREQCSSFWQKINIFGLGETAKACEKYKLSLRINDFLRGGNNWFSNAVKEDSKVYALMEGEKFDRAIEISEPDSSTNVAVSNISEPVLDGLAGMAQIDSKSMNPLGVIVNWGNILMTIGMVAYTIGLIGNGSAWTDIAFTLGALVMIPGFILAFWVPTIPFMHFVFAVIEWMISVLEAVIGMPLWALSMITLEGDGLGKLGMAGLRRIFEITIRPTIIVLSLVASILIFSAGVGFFNSALAMYSQANSADDGFFTGMITSVGMIYIYMFGIYSLATASFKLIDTIPDKYGRWMGLEQGFGGDMKSGLSGLQQMILAGGAIKGLQDMTGSVGKIQKGRKAARDDKAAKSGGK